MDVENIMGFQLKPKVTVIIATTLEEKRKDAIYRAITSVFNQTYEFINLFVIINGQLFDQNLKNEIEQNEKIESFYLSIGSYPEALKFARAQVKTEYFCFLDDDDELTNNSIEKRLAEFEITPSLDVVVGNGAKLNSGNLIKIIRPEMFSAFSYSPINSLMMKQGNWLASCAGLFKSSSVTVDYFIDYAKYAEWSYLAAKLSITKNMILIDECCYYIHSSAESLSKSESYVLGLYKYLKKMKALDTPASFQNKLAKKIINYEHTLAEYYKNENKLVKAWKYHCLSLFSIYGFKKYIMYSRKLLIF